MVRSRPLSLSVSLWHAAQCLSMNAAATAGGAAARKAAPPQSAATTVSHFIARLTFLCGMAVEEEGVTDRTARIVAERHDNDRERQKLTVVVNVILRGSGFTKLVRICIRGLPANNWLAVSVV